MTADREHAQHAGEPAVELAAREADGLQIVLVWRPRDDRLEVVVEDTREGLSFTLAASTGKEALEAYHHPFAYSAAHGIADPRSRRGEAPSTARTTSRS